MFVVVSSAAMLVHVVPRPAPPDVSTCPAVPDELFLSIMSVRKRTASLKINRWFVPATSKVVEPSDVTVVVK